MSRVGPSACPHTQTDRTQQRLRYPVPRPCCSCVKESLAPPGCRAAPSRLPVPQLAMVALTRLPTSGKSPVPRPARVRHGGGSGHTCNKVGTTGCRRQQTQNARFGYSTRMGSCWQPSSLHTAVGQFRICNVVGRGTDGRPSQGQGTYILLLVGWPGFPPNRFPTAPSRQTAFPPKLDRLTTETVSENVHTYVACVCVCVYVCATHRSPELALRRLQAISLSARATYHLRLVAAAVHGWLLGIGPPPKSASAEPCLALLCEWWHRPICELKCLFCLSGSGDVTRRP